jgi:hypothetical protein
LGEGEKVDELLIELAEQINMVCGTRPVHGAAQVRQQECAELRRAAQEAAEDDEAPF